MQIYYVNQIYIYSVYTQLHYQKASDRVIDRQIESPFQLKYILIQDIKHTQPYLFQETTKSFNKQQDVNFQMSNLFNIMFTNIAPVSNLPQNKKYFLINRQIDTFMESPSGMFVMAGLKQQVWQPFIDRQIDRQIDKQIDSTHQSPSGMVLMAGLKQQVWQPLSQLSQSRSAFSSSSPWQN